MIEVDEKDVPVLYICDYGQTGIPICVDLEHEHCALSDEMCNLRPVVSYNDYKALKDKLEKVKQTLEYYADSRIGTPQDNGTYKIDCGGDAVIGSFSCLVGGSPFVLPYTFTYDPRPAKEALKLIGD